ncbi:MAG: carotenoid 1,2-hydratase [Proteobacteria bacterium]|nr:carotenoid 1,2-hydratase [Pseudomonadota bacterium]
MLVRMDRRTMLTTLALLAARGAPAAETPRALAFPTDFGAHPETRIEWWYITGHLDADARRWGFQITFFRSATGLAADSTSRFAARQLVFAHAALTDLQQRRLRHDERIARSGFGIAEAATGDTALALHGWRLARSGTPERSRYHAELQSERAAFGLMLDLDATQPVLLQGVAGTSRKGPRPEQASRYYSEPQLAVHGTLIEDGRSRAVQGRAWLDHEWSDALLAPDAVGWDWIGMNLDDGSALTAFRLRRADGGALWAGGSFRAPGQAVRDFGPDEVRFTPGRAWQSAASGARYPVAWTVETPVGRTTVEALLDAQELDSRASTGSVYWEGLSALLDAAGRRIGIGYLELTGYAARLRL